MIENTQRSKILSELARYTGKIVPWNFIKETSRFIPGIDRFHNLITGIYKPHWSEYALSIIMRINSPYHHKDEFLFLEDGRWLMTYAPRSGGFAVSDNKALKKCMDKQVPLGIFVQETDKRNRQVGSTYRVMGLGLISQYDEKAMVFLIEAARHDILDDVTNIIPDPVERYKVQLYAQLTNDFRPFINEEKITYSVTTQKRDAAFRNMILQEYDFTCSVCQMKFRIGDLIESQAAHIVPKRKCGTDDPRNGLALCRTHHWAFDSGIFSINDNYSILVSPLVNRAEKNKFDLFDLNGKLLLLPDNTLLYPHKSALAWHRREVLLAT